MASSADPFVRSQRKETGPTVAVGTSQSLTNLTTKSDALGKPIPRSWGHVVVGGALVWASPFYQIVSKFQQSTQFYSDVFYISGPKYGQEESFAGGTTITQTEKTEYGIDLCYSFGFDGENSAKRKVFRVKVNGVLVYDGLDGYVMPGIGFDIREHTDLDRPAAMIPYELTGKYFYPGQTLITFSQFRTKDWGGAVPQSVEVEFVTEGALSQSGYIPVIGDYGNYDDLIRQWGFIDVDRRLQYFFVKDIKDGTTRAGVRVFNLDTGAFLTNIPFTGAGPVNKDAFNQFYIQMAFCSKLNVLVTQAAFAGGDVYHAAFIDFNDGKAELGLLGGNSQNGYAVISDSVTKAEVLSSSIGNGLTRIVLTRSNGVITGAYDTCEQSTANGLGWFDQATGWGDDGAALVDVGNVWLMKTGGKITRCARPVELDAISPNYAPSYPLAFNGGAVTVYSANGFPNYVVAHNPDGTVRNVRAWQDGVAVIYNLNQGYYAPPSERFYGCMYFTDLKYIDLITLITISYPGPMNGPGGNNFDMGYDRVTNRVVNAQRYPDGTYYGGFAGPELKTGKVPLSEFIRSLYVNADIYAPNQVTFAADIYDEVTGALLVATVDVNALVEQLCQLYRLKKTVTNQGVNFYKISSAQTSVVITATIDVSELAMESTEQDNDTPLKSTRKSDELTPAAIELKYIDPAAQYTENSISWRRVDAGTSAQGNELKIALPLVMSSNEALYLVQQAVVNVAASVYTHEFRLPWKYACWLQPDDIVKITDGPYSHTIQIDRMDINGDLSASCSGTSIGIVNVSDIAAPAVVPPSQPISTAVVDSDGYIFDTPLLTPRDNPAAGSILEYLALGPRDAGTYNGGYFARRPDGGDWESLPSIISKTPVLVYRAKNVLTDKRWTLDLDGLELTKVSGSSLPTKTLAQVQADPLTNIAWYGKPGRWEIVKVLRINNLKTVGVLRGLRGTEIHAGKHEIGDLLVFAQTAVVHETRPIARVGAVEEWRPVSVGKGFGSAASLPLVTVEGNSARPYAPAAVLGQRSEAGDVSLTWARRDRLGSAWGATPLPLSDPLDFLVRVLGDDGATVTREWRVTAETATYTAADQATDGNTGKSSLKVSVAQMGATGPGFSEVVTIDGL